MRRAVPILLVAGALPVFLLGAFLGGAASASTDAKTDEVQAGNQLFLSNCMQCHAVVDSQSSFGPNLHGVLKLPHPKKTPTEVKELLESGKGKMPSFKNKLSEQDEDALVKYLRTL
jgi:mono/diheme cytochrome c family protein